MLKTIFIVLLSSLLLVVGISGFNFILSQQTLSNGLTVTMKRDSISPPSFYSTPGYSGRGRSYALSEDTLKVCYVHDNGVTFKGLEQGAQETTYPFPNGMNVTDPRTVALSVTSENFFYLLEFQEGTLWKYENGSPVRIANLQESTELSERGLFLPYLLDMNSLYVKGDSLIYFPLQYREPHEIKSKAKKGIPHPLTASYNIKTKKVTVLPPHINASYYKNSHGFTSSCYQTCNGKGDIIYYYNGMAEISRFDTDKNTLTTYHGIGKSVIDTIYPVSLEVARSDKDYLVEHHHSSGEYMKLYYNPFKHCYYRFVGHPLPKYNENGLRTIFKDRRVSLFILDEDFNVLAETLLPEKCFFIFLAVSTPEGIIINHGPAKPRDEFLPTLHIKH